MADFEKTKKAKKTIKTTNLNTPQQQLSTYLYQIHTTAIQRSSLLIWNKGKHFAIANARALKHETLIGEILKTMMLFDSIQSFDSRLIKTSIDMIQHKYHRVGTRLIDTLFDFFGIAWTPIFIALTPIAFTSNERSSNNSFHRRCMTISDRMTVIATIEVMCNSNGIFHRI